MKTLFFLIALLIITSCTDLGSTKTYTFTVNNDSSTNIKIIGYVKFTNVEEYIINLENEESLTKSFESGSPPRGYSWNSFFGSSNGNSGADSIKIIYDSTKFEKFGINNLSDPRNPLGPNHNDGELEATYTITQEDYENAEPCNGDCE